MIRHPFVFIGAFVCILGWIWLLFGVETSSEDVESGSFIWSVKIAETIIRSGFFILIAGVLMAGFESIRLTLIYHPEIASGEEYSKRKERARRRVGWLFLPYLHDRAKPQGGDRERRGDTIEDWLGK